MENKIIHSNAYGKTVFGVLNNPGTDVMITFYVPNGDKNADFHDYFLTTKQAEELVKQINKALEYNKQDFNDE